MEAAPDRRNNAHLVLHSIENVEWSLGSESQKIEKKTECECGWTAGLLQSLSPEVLTASCGVNMDHGVLAVGDNTDAESNLRSASPQELSSDACSGHFPTQG